MDFSKYLSESVKNLTESATIRMTQLARDLRAEGHDVISLSIGEPDFDTPAFVREAAKKALDEGYTHYTPVPGLAEFRKAIVEKLARDNGLRYNVSNIVVSNGAKQTIYNLCRALLNPGDEVIIFTPYWVSYIEIVKLCGGTPVVVSASVDEDYKISPEKLESAITKRTKFVLFSSPSNPTGSVYTQEELHNLAGVLARYEDVLIVSDEIYEFIVFGETHYSIAQNPEVFERTIVVNGMSKGFAMTGWRLGYMAAPEDIASACSKIQGQVTSGASSFGQKAAATALLSDLQAPGQMTETFKTRRDLVLGLLKDIDGLKVNEPQGAFYVFPDCSNFFGKSDGETIIKDSNDLAEALLTKVHVATVAGAAFGAPSCIRLSYAASEEQLIEACRRMKSYFESLQ
jgi:aspartate aminotransferase